MCQWLNLFSTWFFCVEFEPHFKRVRVLFKSGISTWNRHCPSWVCSSNSTVSMIYLRFAICSNYTVYGWIAILSLSVLYRNAFISRWLKTQLTVVHQIALEWRVFYSWYESILSQSHFCLLIIILSSSSNPSGLVYGDPSRITTCTLRHTPVVFYCSLISKAFLFFKN